MSEDTLLQNVYDSLLGLNEAKTIEATKECIASGVEPEKVMKGLADAMIKIGDEFNARKLFLPHVVIAAGIMDKANKLVLEVLDVTEGAGAGKIVIGTIEGDIHELGKSIVAAMLKTAGFEVIDLGKDVQVKKYLETAVAEDADIIACSSLMSSTMPYLKDVVDLRNDMGHQDRFKVMVGGGPVNQTYADQVGADAYAEDAMEAVKVAQKLVSA
ncbi:MAG: cobalamin-dependent protein [Methanosarcinaceae archaeon]|nr:cobalamin-dependent protein [Methanosarcinaceae archaeon]